MDYVIDTLGAGEFQRELSVLKPGGRLLSLRIGPNKRFAAAHHFGLAKRALFTIAGAKYDRAAKNRTRNTILSLCAPMAHSFGKSPKLWNSITLFQESIPGSLPWRRRRTPLRWCKKVGSTERYSFRWTKKDKNSKQKGGRDP